MGDPDLWEGLPGKLCWNHCSPWGGGRAWSIFQMRFYGDTPTSLSNAAHNDMASLITRQTTTRYGSFRHQRVRISKHDRSQP